jgi:hypothetical protein
MPPAGGRPPAPSRDIDRPGTIARPARGCHTPTAPSMHSFGLAPPLYPTAKPLTFENTRTANTRENQDLSWIRLQAGLVHGNLGRRLSEKLGKNFRNLEDGAVVQSGDVSFELVKGGRFQHLPNPCDHVAEAA